MIDYMYLYSCRFFSCQNAILSDLAFFWLLKSAVCFLLFDYCIKPEGKFVFDISFIFNPH